RRPVASRPCPPGRAAGPLPPVPGPLPLMPEPFPDRPDADLVDQARSGDRRAFEALLRRHDDKMRGLAYRLLADRHAMDDALQEAYVKAYRALPRFKAGSNFGTWLYRITYNACIDALRKRKRTPVAADDTVEPRS